MGFEGIMLSEISQVEKDKYHMISLICEIYQTKQTNKQNNKTHTYSKWIGGYQRGREMRVGKKGKGSQ